MSTLTNKISASRLTLRDLPSHKLLQRALVAAAGCDVDEWDREIPTPPDAPCMNTVLVYGSPHHYVPLPNPPDDPSKTVADLLLDYLET